MINADTLAVIEAVEEFIDSHDIGSYAELTRNIRSMHTEAHDDWHEWRTVLMDYSKHFEAYCKGIQKEGASTE